MAVRPFSKQFVPNILMNIVAMAFSGLVGVLLVPYYIDSLGIAAYGVLPIAVSAANYAILIPDSLTFSVQRQIAMALHKDDISGANVIHSTGFFGMIRLVTILIPIIIVVALISPFLFSVPENMNLEVQILFMCVLASSLITASGSAFQNVLFASNRLDLKAFCTMLLLGLQVAFLILFFNLSDRSLISVGVAYICAAPLVLMIGFFLSRKIQPNIRAKLASYDKSMFKDLILVGFWYLMVAVGTMLFMPASLIIVNLTMGPIHSAEFSIIVSVVSMIIGIAGAVSTAVAPLVYSHYAHEENEEMLSNARLTIKATGLFISMPVAFICIFAPQILTVWVGPEFLSIATTLSVAVSVLVFSEVMGSLIFVCQAGQKVKALALSMVFFGIMNMMLSYTLVVFTDLGILSFAISYFVTMFLRNAVFLPYFTSSMLETKPIYFYSRLVFVSIVYAAQLILCWVISALLPMTSLITLIAVFLPLFLVYSVISLRFLLSREERCKVRSCIPGVIVKYIPRWIL